MKMISKKVPLLIICTVKGKKSAAERIPYRKYLLCHCIRLTPKNDNKHVRSCFQRTMIILFIRSKFLFCVHICSVLAVCKDQTNLILFACGAYNTLLFIWFLAEIHVWFESFKAAFGLQLNLCVGIVCAVRWLFCIGILHWNFACVQTMTLWTLTTKLINQFEKPK